MPWDSFKTESLLVSGRLLLKVCWLSMKMDDLNDIPSHFVARNKIQIDIDIWIEFTYSTKHRILPGTIIIIPWQSSILVGMKQSFWIIGLHEQFSDNRTTSICIFNFVRVVLFVYLILCVLFYFIIIFRGRAAMN
jgi:hypothetical protein